MLILAAAPGAHAERLMVAVASNFVHPAESLAARFEALTGHDVIISPGSTGKLYAQAVNGAPYAILLAADADRPAKLEASGHGIDGTRFTYAIGSLVLWSADSTLTGVDCRRQLESLGNRHLAIANPLTAPYGIAARSFLDGAGLLDVVRPNLVYGENISQTLQFVASLNASLGIIAAAQLQNQQLPTTACRWPIPTTMHAPIEQQAILLRRAADSEVALDFLDFLKSADGIDIIVSYGYDVPDTS